LATLLLAVAAVLGVAAPAAAHAVLVSSDPADGSRLDASPAQVTLHFDEAVQLIPGDTKALSTDGTRVDTARPRQTDGDTSIVLPLKPDLPRGSYTVTWRIVSADTHIVVGSISFGVRQNAQSATATTTPTTAVDVIADAAKGLGYLGAVLAFGVAALGRLFWPWTLRRRRLRILGWTGGAALAVGALVELLLQGPRATGSGLSGVAHLDDLGQTLSSQYGVSLVIRLVLLAVLAVLRPWRATARPSSWVPRLALAIGVLATIAVSGHAGVGTDAALAVPVAILHLAAMCVWLGGLVGLAVIVLPRWRAAPRIHPRLMFSWSITAFVSVAVLIVTGEYQAWREVQPLASLWGTGYGVTLSIKIGLVIVALIVALAVRYRAIAPRAGATIGFRTVRRSILVETVLVALVVGVTTVLVAQPPASTTYGPPARLSAPLGPDTVAVAVDTTRRGPEKITVTALDAHGDPVALSAISGLLSSDDAEVAGIDVSFRHGDGDSWSSVGAAAPVAGHWMLTLNVAIEGGASYATSTSYAVW
ncbi:MAG TPA: copper resistance protein CopC, partial [Pseudolysinimonas sp.]